MYWYDGQSGGVTPGPIPNPAVKPARVPVCTVLRKRTGTQARCQPLFHFYYVAERLFHNHPSLGNHQDTRWTTHGPLQNEPILKITPEQSMTPSDSKHKQIEIERNMTYEPDPI